jgi:hypothetical protein
MRFQKSRRNEPQGPNTEGSSDLSDLSLPVLKITRSVLTGYGNSLLYLILQPLTRNGFGRILIEADPF